MTDLNVLKPALQSFDSLKTATSEYSEGKGAVRTEPSQNEMNKVAEQDPPSDIQSYPEVQSSENEESLDELMSDLNSQMEVMRNYLRFEKDEDSERMVIFIKDSETDEIIRQIPSQEFLDISKNISKYLEMRQQLSETMAIPTGLITDTKA